MYKEDLDLLKSTRSKTLDMVKDLSDAELRFAPNAGIKPFEIPFLFLRVLSPPKRKWSIGEVLDHLFLFESVFREDISIIVQLKKSNRNPVLRLGFEEINVSFGFIPKAFLPVLEIPVGVFSQVIPNEFVEFLTSNRLLPAQNPDVAAPKPGRSAEELRDGLRDSLVATERLFEANPDLDYKSMYRQHPTTGRQNVLEALRMIALHEQRHQTQIQEILDDQDFPK